MGKESKANRVKAFYRGYPRLIPLAVFLPVNVLALAVLTVSLVGNGVELSGSVVVATAPFAVPPSYFAVRAFFVGVWLDSRGIRCVSWFRTFRYPFAAIRRVDAVNYNGLFTGGRDSFLTAMLLITLMDGRTREIRGSIATHKAMRDETRKLRQILATAGTREADLLN